MTTTKSKSLKPKTGNESSNKSKRRWRWLDIAVALAVVSLVSFGLWRSMTVQLTNGGPCKEPGLTETVNLNHDAFSKQAVRVNRCDRLRVVNLDSSLSYRLAFGAHDKHLDYPGFSERVLGPNEYVEIDAVEAGRFTLHEHLRDNAQLLVEISE